MSLLEGHGTNDVNSSTNFCNNYDPYIILPAYLRACQKHVAWDRASLVKGLALPWTFISMFLVRLQRWLWNLTKTAAMLFATRQISDPAGTERRQRSAYSEGKKAWRRCMYVPILFTIKYYFLCLFLWWAYSLTYKKHSELQYSYFSPGWLESHAWVLQKHPYTSIHKINLIKEKI